MNKQHAIEILEMVERRTLDNNSPLFKEAVNYLERLKKLSDQIKDRIYKAKYKP